MGTLSSPPKRVITIIGNFAIYSSLLSFHSFIPGITRPSWYQRNHKMADTRDSKHKKQNQGNDWKIIHENLLPASDSTLAVFSCLNSHDKIDNSRSNLVRVVGMRIVARIRHQKHIAFQKIGKFPSFFFSVREVRISRAHNH